MSASTPAPSARHAGCRRRLGRTFSVDPRAIACIVGADDTTASTSYAIDYALQLLAERHRGKSAKRTSTRTKAPSPRLTSSTVAVEGTAVKYYKNGVAGLHEPGAASRLRSSLDTSLATVGATVQNLTVPATERRRRAGTGARAPASTDVVWTLAGQDGGDRLDAAEDRGLRRVLRCRRRQPAADRRDRRRSPSTCRGPPLDRRARPRHDGEHQLRHRLRVQLLGSGSFEIRESNVYRTEGSLRRD